MRVALRELKAVRRSALLARYAQLGPVTFIHAELADGVSGTDLAQPCRQAHWGLTLHGELVVHGENDRTLGPGTAWHVPSGSEHTFDGEGRIVVAGFTPVPEPIDDSAPTLERLGLVRVDPPGAPSALPADFVPLNSERHDLETGAIRVATAQQGAWVCMRASFGPRSGYASGWCDLPHWGLVLRGDLIVRYERSVELLGPGDVYYCPAGPPGHQFEVADSASIIDYTPLEDLERRDLRRSTWRVAVTRHEPVALGRDTASGPGATSGRGRRRAMGAGDAIPGL